MRTPTVRCLVLLSLAVCASIVSAAEHTKDALESVRKRVRGEKAVLVDVREESEWKAGHLRRAEFVPLSDLRTKRGLEAALKRLPKTKPLYLHCRSGGRCLVAGEILSKHGYDVRPLAPGYEQLLKAGFEKAK